MDHPPAPSRFSRPTSSATAALAGLSLSVMLSSLGTSIANVALPTVSEVFRATFQEVQWIVLAFLLAVTTLIVGAGRLGDVVGRRRLLLAGIALFTSASAMCGVAPTLWSLIAARALQGTGAAVMMALTMAFVGETVPKEKTGSAMGLLGTMSAIGTALGPSLGGVLISWLGWQAVFLVNVPLGVGAFLLTYRYLPTDSGEPKSQRARFDHAGTAVVAFVLAAYALSMTVGRGGFGPLNLALLVAAVAGGGLFVLVELKASSPLIPWEAFRNRTLAGSLGTNALVATVMMATLVVGPFYLSQVLAFNAALVGIVMAVGPVLSTLSGIPAGRMVDRLGAPITIVVGLIGMAAGSLLLAILPAVLGVAGYVVAIAVLTPGYQLFLAANNTVVMKDVSSGNRGVISGMLNLSRNLGLVTGASVMGAVFASATGDTKTANADAITHGTQITFGVTFVLIIGALAIAIVSDVVAQRRTKK